MAIHRGFLPAAPGWVRWPAYLLAFLACYLAMAGATLAAIQAAWPAGGGPPRWIGFVLWTGMIRAWFGGHDTGATDPPAIAPPGPPAAEPRPARPKGDGARLIITATAILLAVLLLGLCSEWLRPAGD